MKQIKTKDGFRQLKETILKNKSYGIAAAALVVVVIAMTAFFSLMKETKDVIEPASETETTGSTTVTTGTTATTSVTAASSAISSTVTTTTRAVSPADNLINSIENQAQIMIVYPDTESGRDSSVYHVLYQADDFKASVGKILDLLPSSQSSAQSFGPGKLITVQFNSVSQTLSIFKPKGGSKTIVRIRSISNTDFWYICDGSIYDKAAEILKPYTTDSVQTFALQFINGLSAKNTEIIKSGTADASSVNSWPIYSMANVTYLKISAGSDKAVYKVAFDLNNGSYGPFQEGHNERILVVEKTGSSLLVNAFIDPAYYAEPKTDAEKMCLTYAENTGGVTFESTSKLSAAQVLNFILSYKKGSVKLAEQESWAYEGGQIEYGFSRDEIARYAKSIFGIDHFDGTGTNYYNVNGDYYYYARYGSDEPDNHSSSPLYYRCIRSVNYNSGNCTVTLVAFSDRIQSRYNGAVQFDLQKNADGTYHFIKVANVDIVG